MIGRKWRKSEVAEEPAKGFDSYDVTLGDLMRGERATLGKSLMDVQRELRIRASYISAIENADPSAFETPGFIAGYVRSYARYLEMDPDETFEKFCHESGFETAHGMSAGASTLRKPEAVAPVMGSDVAFQGARYIPEKEGLLDRLEPRALASSFVLLALIGGLGYGAVSVVNEIQRVDIAPVDQTPVVLSDLDPVDPSVLTAPENVNIAGVFTPPAQDLDRLYRPQALDVPVLVARDAPISTLNPQSVGAFTPEATVLETAELYDTDAGSSVPQVVEDRAPEVVVFAVRPAWMSIKSADGTTVFQGTMNSAEEFLLPASEVAPIMQSAGMSGYVYVRINGEVFGPLGSGTSVARDVSLDIASLTDQYQAPDLSADAELSRVASLITPVGAFDDVDAAE